MPTYYVRADGVASKANATNPGSASTSMNLSTFMTQTSAGDTIQFSDAGGVYYLTSPITLTNNGTSGSPIIITKVPGQTPTIDGSYDIKGTTGNWTFVNPYWTSVATQGALTRNAMWLTKGALSGPGYLQTGTFATAGDYTTLSDDHFQVYTDGPTQTNPATYFATMRSNSVESHFILSSKSYITIDSLTFRYHALLSPTEFTGASTGAVIYVRGCDHITVSNNTISHAAVGISSSNSTNVVISNNTINNIYCYNCADDPSLWPSGSGSFGPGQVGSGILFCSGSTEVGYNILNGSYTLYNGTTRNLGGVGIYAPLQGTTNNMAENCWIHHNEVSHIVNYHICVYGLVAPAATTAINGIIEHNYCHDGNVIGNIDDAAKDTDAMAVGDENLTTAYYTSIHVRYNWVDRCGNSVWQTANSWRDIHVYYNLGTNNGSVRYCWGGIEVGQYDYCYNNTLYNIQGGCDSAIYCQSGAVVKNNVIHTVTANSVNRAGYGIHGNSGGYNCVYNTSGDAISGSANTGDIFVNPSFLNGSGLFNTPTDFQLTFNSQCVNAGTPVGLTQDYLGNPVPA